MNRRTPPPVPTPASPADLLLINAHLRDELEPYRDEAIDGAIPPMPLDAENEYLASMLAWELAPALPIGRWFDPPLVATPPDQFDDDALTGELRRLIDRLASKNVLLRCTDHLTDRELYTLIYRDILPATEKMVPGRTLHWQCVDDTITFLRFYADPVERRRYQEEYRIDLPEPEPVPHPRQLP